MVLLTVLLSAGSASALIWHPKNPKNSIWDTWLFAQPGQDAVPKFYMNYLSSCDASCGGSPSRDPAGCCGWNGVGAAISSDGVHYEDQGVVVHKDADAAWLGSGSVLKNSDGEYVMNFSEEYDCQPADPKAKYGTTCQSIFFATSKDLKNWTRLAFKPPPANDTEVFKYSDGGLGGTTPGYEIGGRWDSIATVPKPGSPGIYYGFWSASPSGHGGAGVGETTDQTGHHWKALPPITDGFPKGEVGSTVVLGDKYYMLFGGGHIYSSDDPIQGYKPDAKNFAFHIDGDGIAYSRLWNVQGSTNESIVLISHQWGTDKMTGSTWPDAVGSKGIYLAPSKEMKVGADGTPRAVQGIWVHGSTDDAIFVWNCATKTFMVGGKPIDRKPGFAAGAPVALKMLLRTTPNGDRGMAEFYANEIMSHPHTFNVGGGKAAKIGVAADLTAVTAVKAWKMTLSSDQESLPRNKLSRQNPAPAVAV